MPKAADTLTTSRRTLLGATPALLLTAAPGAAAAAEPANPDAELTRLVDLAMARETYAWELTADLVHIPEDVEAEQDRVLKEVHDLHDRIEQISARTYAGLAAKARFLRFSSTLIDVDGQLFAGAYRENRIAFSLAADAIRLASAA